jgi:hypothetical protein
MWLQPCDTKERKTIANAIIVKYHSYKATSTFVGRRIDWLIKNAATDNDQNAIGAIGIASSIIFLPKVVTDYFGLAGKYDGFSRRWLNLNWLAVNWRFTLTDRAEPNAASQALGILVKIAAKAWKDHYGDGLAGIMTFVGAGKEGTIYKATGWTYLGKTRGSTLRKGMAYGADKHLQGRSSHTTKGGIPGEVKLVYFKPVIPDWRERLLKKHDDLKPVPNP